MDALGIRLCSFDDWNRSRATLRGTEQ